MSSYFGSLMFGRDRFGSSGMAAPNPIVLSVPDAAIVQGRAVTVTVGIERSGGFAAAVALSLDPEPGVTGVFAPASAAGDSSQLILTVELGKSPGDYTLRVRADGGGGMTGASVFTLTVTPALENKVTPLERTLVVPDLLRTATIERTRNTIANAVAALLAGPRFVQSEGERLPYRIDFSPWLGTDRLASASVDAGALMLHNLVVGETEMSFELSGGVLGGDDTVVATINSATGRTLQRSLMIQTRPTRPMQPTEFIKDPDSVLDYALDFSRAIPEDVTIQALVWSFTNDMVAESTRLEARTAVVWLSGGAAGYPAQARALATLSNGWKAAVVLELAIQDQ
jgi:hypothetical protein